MPIASPLLSLGIAHVPGEEAESIKVQIGVQVLTAKGVDLLNVLGNMSISSHFW